MGRKQCDPGHGNSVQTDRKSDNSVWIENKMFKEE